VKIIGDAKYGRANVFYKIRNLKNFLFI